MEEQSKGHKTIYIVIILLALLFFIWLIFYLASRFNPSLLKGSISSTVPSATTIPLQKGKMYLKIKDDQSKMAQSGKVTVVVYADSDKMSISGYDIVLKYDSKRYKYLNYNNVQADFQSFPFAAANKVTITGIRKLTSLDSVIFTDTALAEITFDIVVPGNVSFSLDFTPGSSKDSNLINDKNKDILGKVEGIDRQY